MRYRGFPYAIRKKHQFPWFNLLLVLLVLLCLTGIADKVNVYLNLRSEIAVCEENLSSVEEDYAAKQEVVELLQDGSYLEYMARKELGMVYEGEHMVWTVTAETP